MMEELAKCFDDPVIEDEVLSKGRIVAKSIVLHPASPQEGHAILKCPITMTWRILDTFEVVSKVVVEGDGWSHKGVLAPSLGIWENMVDETFTKNEEAVKILELLEYTASNEWTGYGAAWDSNEEGGEDSNDIDDDAAMEPGGSADLAERLKVDARRLRGFFCDTVDSFMTHANLIHE